jgi:hypothetical protein
MARVARRRFRVWRGFVLGAMLLPFNVLWVFWMESMGGQGPYVSTISMFFNVIFIMVFVALGNSLLRRLRPSLALNWPELIIVYVMLTMSTTIMGHDMMQVLVSMLTTGYWFANPQNRWEHMLNGTTPSWLVISDHDVLYGYWNGSTTMYQLPVLRAWLTPILWWGGLMVVLVFVMICFSVVLRPLWADRERLTFPIIQLPLELANPASSLFRNPLMWVGFGLAGTLDLINGFAYIFPSIPSIPVGIDLAPRITNWPWSGVGWLPVTFNPSVIGLSFLMPLDLLFSSVFFFLYWKLMYVIATATGVTQGYTGGMTESVFPYSNEQMFGGFIAVALGSLLLGRTYLKHVWLRAIGRRSEVDDSGEGLSFRTALIGIVVGLGLLIAFAIHGRLSPSLSVSFFVIYALLALAVARIRAEFGSPVHDFHHTGPDYTLAYVLGTMNLRQTDLGMLQQFFWFNRAYRGHAIGDTLEGLQMGARAEQNGRPIVIALVLATVMAIIAAFWGWMYFAYKIGASGGWVYGADWFGRESYGRLQSWIESPKPANFVAPVAMAAGFAISMLLALARARFAGWPLHPVAFALSASWSIHLVWMPMFIAWLTKLLVLRYGGLRFYRRVLPFFFGLIMGESVVGCAWPLVGLIFHVPSYNFFGS